MFFRVQANISFNLISNRAKRCGRVSGDKVFYIPVNINYSIFSCYLKLEIALFSKPFFYNYHSSQFKKYHTLLCSIINKNNTFFLK